MIFECCLAEKQQSKSKQAAMQNGGGNVNDASSSSPSSKLEPTWIHQIFQGTFTSETRCLNCETVILDIVLSHLLSLCSVFVFRYILSRYTMSGKMVYMLTILVMACIACCMN